MCCAGLCCAVVCYAVLYYAAGERRQALEAFVAAFGVEAGGSPATSDSHADPVLQVSHAVTTTTHCCWMLFLLIVSEPALFATFLSLWQHQQTTKGKTSSQ